MVFGHFANGVKLGEQWGEPMPTESDLKRRSRKSCDDYSGITRKHCG